MVGNSYKDRNQEVGAHSDNTALLGPLPVVAGLSFGSTRIFRLEEITGCRKGGTETGINYNIHIPHNSLYIVRGRALPCVDGWMLAPACSPSDASPSLSYAPFPNNHTYR